MAWLGSMLGAGAARRSGGPPPPSAPAPPEPTPVARYFSAAHKDALDLLHAAASADEAGQAEAALPLYERGTERLLDAMRDEADEERKAQLRARAEQCLERAELLKRAQRQCSAAGQAAAARAVQAAPSPRAQPARRQPVAAPALPPQPARRQPPIPLAPNGGRRLGGHGGGSGGSCAGGRCGGRGGGAVGGRSGGGLGGDLTASLEERAIASERPSVRWDDVAGLDAAKAALQEAVVLPLRFPNLFEGERRPWKGILLYGPPGTGKSHLAKAVATEVEATFFFISSSDLTSKWVGESEKLVRALFESAAARKPSVIFIDEVDALCSSRSDGESESSRRLKNEMLVRMSDVSDSVLVLGATNLPWALDPAVRRRFERRIYIPLPDVEARLSLLRIHLGSTPHTLDAAALTSIARRCDGLSGADISVLVRDALMEPVRQLQAATHFAKDAQGNWHPAQPNARGARPMRLMEVPADNLGVPLVTANHFERVLNGVRPTVGKEELGRFMQFTRDFGSG